MMIQVKTYRPFRRFVLIRFKFSLLCMFLLTVILFGTVIWMSENCNSSESMHFVMQMQSTSWQLHTADELQQIKEAKSCFQPENSRVFENVQLLKDVLEAEEKPKPGKAIFFHETSCIQNGIAVLNSRQACAIESAAKWHPERDVFVIFTSKVGLSQDLESSIMRALHSYPNIHFRNINLTTYSSETPMEQWLQTDQLFLSHYLISHTSDFLRYTSMFKYGGIYFDLDVVVQQSFDSLPLNFAAIESEKFVAVGGIGFQANGVGHEIADLCTREFTSNFEGRRWGNNGPGVLTRVLNRICGVNSTFEMTPERCRGFKVFPAKAFYAIPFSDYHHFFDQNATRTTLSRTKNSMIVHVWNKRSFNEKIRKGEKKTAYEIIANKNCPLVYQASGDEF